MSKFRWNILRFLTFSVASVMVMAGCGGGGEKAEVFYGYDFAEPLIVNTVDQDGKKVYLKLDLTLSMSNSQTVTDVGTRSQQLRHITTVYLNENSKNLVSLGQDGLAEAIKEALDAGGIKGVEAVLFRGYVMQ